jgi:hypothetical protein
MSSLTTTTEEKKMKNYLVVESTKNNETGEFDNFKGYKEFKNAQSALKCAYKRNEMISIQCLRKTYLVYDRKQNVLLKSEKVA